LLLRLSLIKAAHFIVLTCAIFSVITLYGFEQTYDYNNYKNWFEIVNSYYSPHFVFKDPFYFLLSIFYGGLGMPVYWVIATLVFLSLFTKLIFIYRFSYSVFFLFVWLYFCRVFFIHDLIQFRIAAASGFGAIFISSLVSNNKKAAIGWLLLAISIHMSTILYFFIYSFFGISKKSSLTNKYFYVSLVFLPICLFLGADEQIFINVIGIIPIIGPRVIPYLNGTYAYETLSLINFYLFSKLFFYVFFVVLNSIKNKASINKDKLVLHYLSFFCSIFGTCLFLLFRWNDALALRFSDTFLVFDILFFSMFVIYFNARAKVLVFLMLITFGFFLLYSSLRV